jgi:hypothetical protein
MLNEHHNLPQAAVIMEDIRLALDRVLSGEVLAEE